jgi:hypothetical protein
LVALEQLAFEPGMNTPLARELAIVIERGVANVASAGWKCSGGNGRVAARNPWRDYVCLEAPALALC